MTRERRERAALELLATHRPAFERTARRCSLCCDDADDALARATEILLTKAPPIEADRLIAWMQTVTRREATALRRCRERLLGDFGAETQLALELTPGPAPDPADLAQRRERIGEVARALARLKPHERLAIGLQAHGYSYAEICTICGWTRTKVNRCLAEGRARLRRLAPAR